MKISENQRKCLVLLNEAYEEDDEHCWRMFSSIAKKTNLEERIVRIAVRALKRKGLVEYEHLFDEDGMIRGSGHAISNAGRTFLK